MSSMDNMLHNYLTKLRIISKIPEHGRLSLTHNDLNIYYGGVISWILRKAYGDNKENSTKYLIDLYREINAFADQLMYNIASEHNDILRRKKLTMIVSLAEKMKCSLIGIRNLIGTYKDYLKVVSLLENLEQDIIIPQYRILLKFIPDIYHTQILKAPITYSHVHGSGLVSTRNRTISESDPGDLTAGTPPILPPVTYQSERSLAININPAAHPGGMSPAAHSVDISPLINSVGISPAACEDKVIPKSLPIDIPIPGKKKNRGTNGHNSAK